MNRYEIYQMCLRKKVFADVASAKKCAAKTTQIQLYVYRCKVCLGFHVTSKPPENVKKRYLTSKLIYDGIEISSEDETYYYIQQTDENEHLLHRGWRKLHGGNPLFWKKKSTVHREIRNRERKKYLAESDLSVSDQSEKPILLNESPRSENHEVQNWSCAEMKDTFRKLQDLSTNGFSSQVSTLRHLFGFSKKEFAEALGVKRTTIVRWESGTEQLDLQDRHIELIDALRMIAENLDQLFEPRMIKVWAERPNPALGGERPKDFAKKPGGVIVMAHLLGSLGREP